jgi:two-component system LytT family response regulator
MPKINGFEMLELLEHHPSVIFTTAFDEYAIRAFEAHAVDYLLKPFSKERFGKAVSKWMEHHTDAEIKLQRRALTETINELPQQHDRIVVKTGNKITIIPASDIEYLQADDDYVRIHTSYGEFLKNKTMQYFAQSMDPKQFVRVHRSYIIQIAMITRLAPYEKDSFVAVLKSGMKIPVSKTGYSKLKEILGL